MAPTLSHSIPSATLNPLSHVFKLASTLLPLTLSIRLLAPSEAPSSGAFLASEFATPGSKNDDVLSEACAALIAQIILLYTPKTNTPRDILLSLPDMSEPKVDRTIGRIAKAANERQQRALVLDLLEGVRGVSIYEAGKIHHTPKKSANKRAVQQQYMEVQQTPTIVNGEEAGLESVAELFGDA